MTKLLEKAFARASKLPASDQDAIASLILDELESERKWQQLFASSPDLLAAMAKEAIDEHRAGKTKPLEPDTL